MSKNCKNCNSSLPENAKFCPNCGEAASEQTIICKNCNKENPAQAKFCKSCGSALAKKSKAPAPKKTQPPRERPLYLNPYFLIMAIALLAMIIATYYNFNLIDSGNRNTPAQDVTQNQNDNQQQMPQTAPPPDPELIEETANQLEQDPNNVQLNIQMGNLLFDSQKFEEAIPYYNNALKVEPNNPDVIVDLGVCYFNLEDYNKAKDLFEQALDKNPNHVNALYNLGVVAVRLREMDVLMESWSKLVEVAPGSPQAAQASQILDEIHSGVEQNQTN